MLGNLIRRLVNGSTAVPNFVGHVWRETGSIAVRHRVVRQPELAAERDERSSLAGWIVIGQSPPAKQHVPLGSNVTLRLAPPVDRDADVVAVGPERALSMARLEAPHGRTAS